MAELFKEENPKPVTTPISSYDVNQIVSNTETYPPVDPTEYKRIISKIMYASVGSRVDVAFALGFLGRYATPRFTSKQQQIYFIIYVPSPT